MKNETARREIESLDYYLQNHTNDYGEKSHTAMMMAIEALTEPINCVKCKHYYETEDDTDVHGYCKMDTAHTNLISKEEAIEMLKALNMMLRSPDGKPISDVCDALDMAIEALQFVKHFDLLKEFQSLQEVVRCKDCRHEIYCYKTIAHTRIHNGFKEHWSEPIDFCSRGERKEE